MKVRLLIWASFVVLAACSSGKKAYDRGDYYEAVVKAVNRLKQKPDHGKSKETLKNAYPLAIQSLEQEAENLLASSANFKFKNTIHIYEKINQLGEIVKSAPAALAVIKQPKSYYEQIGGLKEKASEELYTAGIQSMMKNTRKDYRQAYYYFKECETFVPRYKEALEMMTQAEEDGTLKIVYDESTYSSWTSAANIIRSLDEIPFIAIYNQSSMINNLESKNKINLSMLVSIKDYVSPEPQIRKKDVVEKRDSVKVGEKTIKNVKVPVYEKIRGRYTSYDATAISTGRAAVTIKDNETGNIVLSQEFEGQGKWSDTWLVCSGDDRVFSKNEKSLCGKGPQKPNETNLKNQAREDLDKKMYATLAAFLRDY